MDREKDYNISLLNGFNVKLKSQLPETIVVLTERVRWFKVLLDLSHYPYLCLKHVFGYYKLSLTKVEAIVSDRRAHV